MSLAVRIGTEIKTVRSEISDLKVLPDQSTNAGKYLTTDGVDATWQDLGIGVTKTEFIATANQTEFTVNYTPGLLDVMVNGVMALNADFIAENGTTITLVTPASENDSIVVKTFDQASGNIIGSYSIAEIDAMVASKADTSLTYTKTEVDASLESKADQETTYSKTEVDAALAFKVSGAEINNLVETDFTATEDQTEFVTSHNASQVQVFIEGVKVKGSDFTADGTTITLVSPVTLGDWVLVCTWM